MITSGRIERKVARGGGDLVALVVDEHVDDLFLADLPGKIAQNGRLAPPWRGDQQNILQAVLQASGVDGIRAAEHFVRNTDIERSNLLDRKSFAVLVDERARKPDPLA